MTDHINDRAGFLAALPDDDEERLRGEAHARDCLPCRQALDEGARLIMLLGEAQPPSAPTRPEMDAAAEAIRSETVDEQRSLRRLSWVVAGAVLVSWAFQLMVGGGFVMDVRHLIVSLAVLAVAVVSITLLRGSERLAVGLVLATSALLAYAAGSASGVVPGIGIRCMFRELWAAAIPWAVVLTVARRRGISLGRWQVTAVAAAGALAAHAGQHVACQVQHAEGHLILFHLSGVVLATVLGAASAARRPALA